MRLTPKYSLLLFILLVLCGNAFSQGNGNIRGFLYTKDNGEPAIFTTVILKGTKMGANTDINGFFSITKIPAGTYTLMATYIGYDTATEVISISGSQIINKKYYLAK